MNEWQIAISLGQLMGTVGALVWFTRGIKAELEKFKQEHYEQIQKLQNSHIEKFEKLREEHYQFREEIAKEYLRREEWLINHNKLEARIEKHFEKIEELIRKKG